MSKPILNLSDSSKWQSLWFGSFTALGIAGKPGYHYPIDPILVPVLLDSRIIAITATSATAKPKWTYAGKARQKIQTGITVGGVVDAASVSVKKLSLDKINFLVFPSLAPTYALEIEPIWWLNEISLSVWIYTGVDSDTVTEQLNRIEFAIDEIVR
jgi:hypothetical protein